jgi:hypothetical protein
LHASILLYFHSQRQGIVFKEKTGKIIKMKRFRTRKSLIFQLPGERWAGISPEHGRLPKDKSKAGGVQNPVSETGS